MARGLKSTHGLKKTGAFKKPGDLIPPPPVGEERKLVSPFEVVSKRIINEGMMKKVKHINEVNGNDKNDKQ